VPLSKRAAIKLIADFEKAVIDKSDIDHEPFREWEGIQRRYDFEHTRVLTALTGGTKE